MRGEAISETHALLAPIQVDALIVMPIVANDATTTQDAIVLDEGFAKGLVVISERNRDGDVNSLRITNKSDRPLFVLSGEVVIGGKQDRIIGANTLIPAKTTQEVPVFCVEHGRWAGNQKGFTSAKALAHGRLRANASYRDQGQVWVEVSQMNNVRNTQNPTDTYRTIATQQSNGALAKQEKKLNAALEKIDASDRKRMVGFVVAIDGTVVTVDMFGSNRLFAKLQAKLVRSYLTESLDVTVTAGNAPPTAAKVKTFMSDSAKGKVETSHDSGASTTSIQRGASSASSSVDNANGNLYKNYNAL
ncbi:MAG: ARPP-1 family domain-containing protein [Kofleriaceae bacterium]